MKKCIIMSEYTSQLTILHYFPEIFSMIHMPLNPQQMLAATLHYFLCKKLTFKIKIYSQTRVSCSIFQNFPEEIYMPPKPLAIKHRAAHHNFIDKQ